jgi:hypothetical protein
VTRRDTTIEERGEPQLVRFRRPLLGDPIELVVVEKGKTTIWTISDQRVLHMIADGSNFLATRQAK